MSTPALRARSAAARHRAPNGVLPGVLMTAANVVGLALVAWSTTLTVTADATSAPVPAVAADDIPEAEEQPPSGAGATATPQARACRCATRTPLTADPTPFGDG
ncbi:hypothetical protein J7I97_36905 [Streptomyces sp. ISL-87]|uniref:hypothetical protein n=1 Tax=Streptomyces sp. ISL-87 TaxID=2819188 RepID=UPI001BEB0348|nr:hypothetical protein [Streptomyces sp. ISL-87]MBT2613642.1 hypothetical protein [Streptomyces sp. ISL-87]